MTNENTPNEMKEILADEKLRNVLAFALHEKIRALIAKRLSKWNRGVYQYAFELAENLRCSQNGKDFFDYLLNDAFRNARSGHFQADKLFNACKEYSESGCALIYDDDICERLSTASEKKRQTRKNGTLGMPNARENWIDVQTRAIFQACLRLNNLAELFAKDLIAKKN